MSEQYTLYIGKGCHQCQDGVEFMKANKMSFKKLHIQKDKVEPPIDLFVFPALFEGERLLCYGTDIVDYLVNRMERPPRKVGLLGKIRILLSRIFG